MWVDKDHLSVWEYKMWMKMAVKPYSSHFYEYGMIVSNLSMLICNIYGDSHILKTWIPSVTSSGLVSCVPLLCYQCWGF